jgi:hypothetical protein
MIFGSLGLLVISTVLLGFGIARSSVTMLVCALLAAAVAALLLLAAYQAHKARLAAAGGGGIAPVAPMGAMPGMMAGGQPIYFVPVMADGQAFTPMPAQTTGGNGHTAGGAPASNGGAPLVGYDDMTATQLVRLIASGALSDDQMRAIATYEETHQARKTVLQALQGTKSDR